MKLYGSLTSPFVRAVRIAAIELGFGGEIEFATTVVRPTEPNRGYGEAVNPLRRVPALETETGDIIIDSRVIIEYLDRRAGGSLVPEERATRIACLNRHAVACGATEGLVSAMYENRLRPAERRWKDWADDQVDKAEAALDWAERRLSDFDSGFDLAAIGLVCLIGYAGFRFPDVDWLNKRAGLAQWSAKAHSRPSVRDTSPREV
jgi:glutathione S-transferase